MRRLVAIVLMVLLLGAFSGAATVACATSCAQMQAPAAAAPAMGMMHMHHHHAMPVPANGSFSATRCTGRLPRVLAQRIIVPGPQCTLAPESRSTQTVNVASTSGVTHARVAASPPGSPVSPAQLRV